MTYSLLLCLLGHLTPLFPWTRVAHLVIKLEGNFDIKIHQEGTNFHQSPNVADLRRFMFWVHTDVSWCNLKFSELLILNSLIREDVGNSFGLSFWRNLLMWKPTLSNLQWRITYGSLAEMANTRRLIDMCINTIEHEREVASRFKKIFINLQD